MVFFKRVTPLAFLLALAATSPAWGQAAPKSAAPAAATAQSQTQTPWLYVGSDVPQDPDWKFGVLPNGVRYAVRKNGVPPGQVSIRVRMDAGSLMEKDSERGFAHLIEHLSFRGSVHVPDGESKRIWQRLGVTFGSDTNAVTTFTNTVYKLDLPSATREGIDQSLKILAGMMDAPNFTQQALDAERPVVLAELREQPAPGKRLQDATFKLWFAGQPLAERMPIGTVETLNGATPEAVKAFHDRWYRPERAVVVISGDVDPAILEQLVKDNFSAWQGVGPKLPSPDFGKPLPNEPVAASLVEPALPPIVSMAVLRPWTVFQDTVIFNQERMIDTVATRLMNRRLESRARAGASYIAAQVSVDDFSRSANITTVQLQPIGDDWETALKDVRSVISEVQSTMPTQEEIDRELAEIDASMKNGVETAAVEPGARQADGMVQAVDINETMTTAEHSYGIFTGAVAKKMFTPERVHAASKRIFEGTATRALVNTRTGDDQIIAKLTSALQANVGGAVAASRGPQVPVSFDKLPALGKPGTVVSRTVALQGPKIEQVNYANGVKLLVYETNSEVGRVYVRVRFGRGMNAIPANRPTPAWAGGMALMQGGVGPYGQEELDRLTGNRQMGFDFAIDEDAFVMGGTTTAADMTDQLKLLATKLAYPRWDPNPVLRARALMVSGYAGLSSSPDGVLSRDLESLLHDKDPRWGTPSLKEIQALTPAAFRKLWEPLLATGPIEVQVYGDMKTDDAIAAVAATFGALKPRKASTAAAPPVRFPAHVADPVRRTHNGQPNQAAAVIAWPTGAGSANLAESYRLDILAEVFGDRLLDKLRSQAGVSYSPGVGSQWPTGLPGGGRIMAMGLVPPDKTDFFFTLAREIAADLVAKPIETDELRRILQPAIQQVIRRSTGNSFWLSETAGATEDPARIKALDSMFGVIGGTTPEALQALAVKYLQPNKDWTMIVVPEKPDPATPVAGK